MALPKKIRGLFSDSEPLPEATEAESGLRRIPAAEIEDDLFGDLPTVVYERPANDVAPGGLADLLEPATPPPVPFVAKFRPLVARDASRVDLDTLVGLKLPPPTVVPDAAPARARTGALRIVALAVGAIALMAAGWLTARVALGASDHPQLVRAAAATTEPAPAPVRTEDPEPELATAAMPAAEPVVLEDIVIRMPARRAPRRSRALPHQPSRAAVLAALRPFHDDVRQCATGHYGVASVRIAVAPSGRVTAATVTGGSVTGTPQGSCIARTLRRARFPEFAAERFVVQYPFQL